MGYLVSVKGEESVVTDVSADRQAEPLPCPSLHRMNAILDFNTELVTIAKIADYVVLQIGDAHYYTSDPVLPQPFNNPLQERLASNLDKAFGKVLSDRQQSYSLAARENDRRSDTVLSSAQRDSRVKPREIDYKDSILCME